MQPDAGEEEKEKEKEKEVGDRGALVDRVAPKRHLHEGASLAFRRGAGGSRCAAWSLGAPFTTMVFTKMPLYTFELGT